MKTKFVVTLAFPLIFVGCSFGSSEKPEAPLSSVPVKSTGSAVIGKPISEGPASLDGKPKVPENLPPAHVKKEFVKDAAIILRTPFSDCGTQEFLEKSAKTMSNALSGSAVKVTDAQRTWKCEVRAAVRENVSCDKLAKEFRNDCEKLKIIAKNAAEGKSLTQESEILYRAYFFSPEVFSPKEFATEKK